MRQNWSILSSDAKEIHLFFYAAVAAAQLSKWRWTVEWGGVVQSPDGHISPVRLDHNDLNYA